MSILDTISIAIVTVIFVLVFLNGAILVQNVGTAFENANAINPGMSTYPVFISAINTIYSADTATVLLYISLWIIVIILGAWLDSEPISLPFAIFMGVICIMVSFVISNAMHAVMGNAIYATVIQNFSQTQYLMANLGALTALLVLVYSIVILARPQYGGGGIGGSRIEVGV